MLKNKEQSMRSHLKQFEKALYSTVGFEKFLDKHNCFKAKAILDIGCGCGAVTNYMAGRHHDVRLVGMDYNQFLINKGKEIATNKRIDNLSFESGDCLNLPVRLKGKFDGIFSVHTLCCFKRIETPIDSLVNLNPNWIAFNSLFYEGPLDVLIHMRNYEYPELDDDPDGDCNIFSLPYVRKYFAKKGYRRFVYEKFKIPERLPRPLNGRRGTYTMKTEIDPRVQFSGPVYLPWYFVLARKEVK